MKVINISGEIGWGVFASEIKKEIESAAGDDLDIKVSSPGGSVFDGIEIYNAFRDYKRKFPNAQIMATASGLVASMASYLMMNPAFDLTAAEDNAVFMIHNVSGGAYGDYRDMKKMTDLLDSLSGMLCTAYCEKTKKTKKAVRSLMDDESWFFGSEIKDAGFIDEIIKTETQKDKESAVAESRTSFFALSEKMTAQKIDINKIAAVLTAETHTSEPPAVAGQNNLTEAKSMNFDELMASNPAAKSEYEKRIQDAKNAGYESGKQEMKAHIEKASVFIASDSKYPNAIKNIAIDVIKGSKSLESLETTVAAFDAMSELHSSASAKDETEKLGDTKGEQPTKTTDSGVIETEADYQAEIIRMKKALGQEVK